MDVTDLTSPASEPVSLGRAKLFLRVDHDAEDALILDMIKAARIQVEAYCGVSLITRSRRFSLCASENDAVIINHYPVQTVDAVRLIHKDGHQTALVPDQYHVNLRARSARLILDIPALTLTGYSVEIDSLVGYGVSEDDIPSPFMQAILLLTAQSYERGDKLADDIPLMVQALLMPYRGVRL